MKKLLLTATLLCAFVIVGSANAQEGNVRHRSVLEVGVGYTNPNGQTGGALHVQYGYGLCKGVDLVAAVEMANGYAPSAGGLTDESSVNSLMVGGRYRFAPCSPKWCAGISLMGGLALNWQYQADVAAAPNGYCGAVWMLDYLVGTQVDLMYRITENTSLGLYGNYRYNIPDEEHHWFGAGVKMAVTLN